MNKTIKTFKMLREAEYNGLLEADNTYNYNNEFFGMGRFIKNTLVNKAGITKFSGSKLSITREVKKEEKNLAELNKQIDEATDLYNDYLIKYGPNGRLTTKQDKILNDPKNGLNAKKTNLETKINTLKAKPEYTDETNYLKDLNERDYIRNPGNFYINPNEPHNVLLKKANDLKTTDLVNKEKDIATIKTEIGTNIRDHVAKKRQLDGIEDIIKKKQQALSNARAKNDQNKITTYTNELNDPTNGLLKQKSEVEAELLNLVQSNTDKKSKLNILEKEKLDIETEIKNTEKIAITFLKSRKNNAVILGERIDDITHNPIRGTGRAIRDTTIYTGKRIGNVGSTLTDMGSTVITKTDNVWNSGFVAGLRGNLDVINNFNLSLGTIFNKIKNLKLSDYKLEIPNFDDNTIRVLNKLHKNKEIPDDVLKQLDTKVKSLQEHKKKLDDIFKNAADGGVKTGFIDILNNPHDAKKKSDYINKYGHNNIGKKILNQYDKLKNETDELKDIINDFTQYKDNKFWYNWGNAIAKPFRILGSDIGFVGNKLFRKVYPEVKSVVIDNSEGVKELKLSRELGKEFNKYRHLFSGNGKITRKQVIEMIDTGKIDPGFGHRLMNEVYGAELDSIYKRPNLVSKFISNVKSLLNKDELPQSFTKYYNNLEAVGTPLTPKMTEELVMDMSKVMASTNTNTWSTKKKILVGLGAVTGVGVVGMGLSSIGRSPDYYNY